MADKKKDFISIKLDSSSKLGKQIKKISEKYNINYNAAFRIVIEELMNKNDLSTNNNFSIDTSIPEQKNNKISHNIEIPDNEVTFSENSDSNIVKEESIISDLKNVFVG